MVPSRMLELTLAAEGSSVTCRSSRQHAACAQSNVLETELDFLSACISTHTVHSEGLRNSTLSSVRNTMPEASEIQFPDEEWIIL